LIEALAQRPIDSHLEAVTARPVKAGAKDDQTRQFDRRARAGAEEKGLI
jgi:hypothetical protein